ncbi:NAD(P)H-dependent oxidoreductase [Anaerotignum sp.]|nr:NAD(P)H-dependent oxidoreductase [Anaerotignum sp.]
MNILAVAGSSRKGGNTEIMAAKFAEAARDAGHQLLLQLVEQRNH